MMNSTTATRLVVLGAGVLLLLNWFIFWEVLGRGGSSSSTTLEVGGHQQQVHRQVAVDIIELQLERKEARIRHLERELETTSISTTNQGGGGGGSGGRFGGPKDRQVLTVGHQWAGRKTRKVNFFDGNSAFVYATTYEGSMASPDQPTMDWWDKIENRWWEMDTYNIYKTFITPQSSFIDFGGWIGPTVLYGATLAKAAYALEPDPYAFDELRANIALNPELQAKTHVYWRCVMDKPGIYPMGGGGGDSMATVGQGNHAKSWKVDCLTLPQFIEEHQIENLDLIKIDTEGAEHIILPSFKSWLVKQTRKPTLWLSIHKWNFGPGGEDAVMDVLRLYRRVVEGDTTPVDMATYELCNFCTILATDLDTPIHRG